MGVAGGALASLLALGGSPACLIPDYCIRLTLATGPVCKAFLNSEGTDAEGNVVSPILIDNQVIVTGCRCFTKAEREILFEGDPESLEYQLLELDIDGEVRGACLEVADALDLVSHCSFHHRHQHLPRRLQVHQAAAWRRVRRGVHPRRR